MKKLVNIIANKVKNMISIKLLISLVLISEICHLHGYTQVTHDAGGNLIFFKV